MRKRIFLNDQGLYVDCIIDGDRISFEFEKELETLNDKVKIIKDEDIIYCFLGFKRFLRIENGNISKVMNITTTEIRVLCALSNRIDYLSKEGIDRDSTIVSEYLKIVKSYRSLPPNWNDQQVHETELHTHFTEILNSEEFIEFLNKYSDSYPINKNGELDFENGEELSYKEIIALGYKNNLINSLRVDITDSSSFDDLNKINKNRRNLLTRIIKYHADSIIKNRKSSEYAEIENEINKVKSELELLTSGKKDKAKRGILNAKLNELNHKRELILSNIFYDDLFVCSLNKLINEKVNYSEISFSNDKRLKYFSEKHKNDDSFNLLFSIHREKEVDDFAKDSKTLEELLNTDKVIGVDLMGHERPLIGKELSDFKKKILWLLPVLHIHPNSLLRIHASEFRDTCDNMLQTLKVIEEVSNELNDACSDLFGRDWGVIPPPRIRIGHGVNINKNPELIRLIKKYDVVVEINASSNYALGHIDSLDDIPLDYYKENGVDYVISTDGGGIYSTSIHQEENLLKENNGEGESLTTEKEQKNFVINNSNEPTQSDSELYEKIKTYQEEKGRSTEYSNYIEALSDEEKIKGDKSDSEFLLFEIKNLSRYIMDLELDIETDYDNYFLNNMIKEIVNMNKSGDSLSAKMYLYLLEKELFKERITPFKTLEYVDKIGDNSKEKSIDKSIYILLKMIEKEYERKSQEIRNNIIIRKRR